MITLQESSTICQDEMEKGIIEVVLKEIPLFRLMPIDDVEGNAYAYNREDPANMGNVGFVDPDEDLTESTAKFLPEVAPLKVLIGQADVPGLIQAARSKVNDQMAAQVAIKTKLFGHKFEDQAVYGKQATSKGFDGLHQWITTSPATQLLTTAVSATPAALSMKMVDQALYYCKAGKADAIILSPLLLIQITSYLRPLGSQQTKRDQYGNLWTTWGEDVPFVTCDAMLHTELCDSNGQYTAGAGASTSLFVVHFGENGMKGIQNGGITTKLFPDLQNKDASRTRIKWYVGTALMNTIAITRLCNIDPALAVTA